MVPKTLLDVMIPFVSFLYKYSIKPGDVTIVLPDNKEAFDLEAKYRSFVFPALADDDDVRCLGVHIRREERKQSSRTSCVYDHLTMEAA